ncbi:MAG TPA: CPBP family intramembrane glutamic endopeptidase [Chloroflexota bacterium]|nr:CPBP family intramembrane glutamic endopeptidase [Chloroflexota bacterium]
MNAPLPADTTVGPPAPAEDPNSVERLRARVAAGRLGWTWPVALALVRLPLILIGYALAYAAYRATGAADPWGAAQASNLFWFTLVVDLPCLALLVWRTRAEGLRLRDLIGYRADRLPLDVGLGLGVGVAMLVILFVVQFALSLALGLSPSGASGFTPPPPWIGWWGVLVFPIAVGFVEEMVYRGYSQPRFEALTGSAGRGVLLMTLAFGAQHLVLPLVSPQVSLVRFGATAATALFLGWVYVRTRRLTALILGHWLADLLGLGLPLLAAALAAAGR